MAGGKKKGSQFERDICKELSLWWSKGKRDDIFWRTAGSGAMATFRRKKSKNTFGGNGDIQATDPIGQDLMDIFTIELKRGYNQGEITSLLDKAPTFKEQALEVFLNQVISDQKNAGSKFWMLIWKRDQRLPMIFLPMKVSRILKDAGSGIHLIPHIIGLVELRSGEFIQIYNALLLDFLKEVSPARVRRLKYYAE